MGYFDPWVTPVVAAVPPNESPGFYCPMHEGVRSVDAGNCPLCGMEMLPLAKAVRAAGELHDPGYTLDFSCAREGAAVGASVPARLRFLLKKDAAPAPLALVHGQLLHLIVVSQELDYFDHVHPVLQADGSLILSYPFPRPGRYLLYTDMTPKGDRAQIFRLPIDVSAEQVMQRHEDGGVSNHLAVEIAGAKLVPTRAVGKTPQDPAPWIETSADAGSALHVELVTQPRTLLAGLHSTLIFRISDSEGRPVTDLQPYIGAMGHCVILSEDTQEYLHCHPSQLTTPAADATAGPTVAFHAHFPKAGRYRIWAQFRRGERLIIAPFTVEVGKPLVPASVLSVLLGD